MVDDVTEYRISNVYVSPTASYIGQDAITYLRCSSDCPWVTAMIEQVDTSTLYNQWNEAYKKYYSDETDKFSKFFENLKLLGDNKLSGMQKEFQDWFNSLRDILDENAETNILNLIAALEEKLVETDAEMNNISSVKANKITEATEGNLVIQKADGDIADSGMHIGTAFDKNINTQIFTSSGSFTAPKTGKYRVTATGAGTSFESQLPNSSGYYAYYKLPGGGGGTGIKTVKLSKGDTVAVTVASGVGASSSFGEHLTAFGAARMTGGNAAGAELAIPGGDAAYSSDITNGEGIRIAGGSYWGSGMVYINDGTTNNPYSGSSPYGVGGVGNHYPGQGVVIVEWVGE